MPRLQSHSLSLALWLGFCLGSAAAAAPEEEKALVFPRDAQELLAIAGADLVVERAAGEAVVVRGEAAVLGDLESLGLRVSRLGDPARLELRGGEVDLRPFALADRRLAVGGPPLPWVVALDDFPDAEAIAVLEQAGAELLGSVPPNGFLVKADGAAARALSALPLVHTVAAYQPEWKAGPGLQRLAQAGAGTAVLEVATFQGMDGQALLRKAEEVGRVRQVFTMNERQVVELEVAHDRVGALLAEPSVEWADRVPEGRIYNEKMRVSMQTEKSAYSGNMGYYNPIYALDVYGSSQLVAVSDTGYRLTHEVFDTSQRAILGPFFPVPGCNNPGDSANHGTGVTATLAGDLPGPVSLAAGTANDHDGLALGASLVLADIGDGGISICNIPDAVASLFAPAAALGAWVHNASWGHGPTPTMPFEGYYSLRSQAIDAHLKDDTYRESVLVFAAGNFGRPWSGPAVYQPRSLSEEAHSKNAIAVGGSRNGGSRHTMYSFSSRGPTSDCGGAGCANQGRVKPDLVAPQGLTTADVAGDSVYATFNGTSVSAPAVSAAAALIRDYFDQGVHYPQQASDPAFTGPPSSAMVKAMLVNSTVFLQDTSAYEGNALLGLPSGAYPNYDQGYGRPALDTVLEPAGYRDLKVWENASTEAATGTVWSRRPLFRDTWQAPCNILRVTLAWRDEPAALGSGKVLVNDLDLEVDLGTTTYLGNEMLTGGVADRYNNVEDVFIPLGDQNGISFRPTIRVIGHQVMTAAPQDFALVATFGPCMDHTPCPQFGGCYAGPGDVVPGTAPPPGCPSQGYSTEECVGCGASAFPSCDPPPPPNSQPCQTGTVPGGVLVLNPQKQPAQCVPRT